MTTQNCSANINNLLFYNTEFQHCVIVTATFKVAAFFVHGVMVSRTNVLIKGKLNIIYYPLQGNKCS